MADFQSPYPLSLLPGTGGRPLFQFRDQEGRPMSGVPEHLRSHSPFVIRLLPPSIYGNGTDLVLPGVSESGGIGSLRTSNRGLPPLSEMVRSNAGESPSQSSYEAYLRSGYGIPGIESISADSLRERSRSFNATVNGSSSSARERAQITNSDAARSILLQIRSILDLPPLVLLVNPQSFSEQHPKISQNQERTRNRIVYQSYGNDVVRISSSLKIGAFIQGSYGADISSGVSRSSRSGSASYQQLMSLLAMFKHGGHIYDTFTGSLAPIAVGNTVLEYDAKSYVGRFETMTLTETEADQNGGLTVDFTFTAFKIFDYGPKNLEVRNYSGPSFRTRSSSTLRRGPDQTIEFFETPSFGGPWVEPTPSIQTPTQPLLNSRRR